MDDIFADMTDAELARFTRQIGRAIARLYGPGGTRAEIGFVAGAAHILVRHAAASNAGWLTVSLEDIERDGERLGDWTIEVARLDAKTKPPEALGPEETVDGLADLEDGRAAASVRLVKDMTTGEVVIRRRRPLN